MRFQLKAILGDAQKQLRRTSKEFYWAFLQTLYSSHRAEISSGIPPELDTLLESSVRNKDIPGLVNACDALVEQTYPTAMQHYMAHQFAALVRKYPIPGAEEYFDPEAKAIANFLEGERHCARINRRFAARRRIKRPRVLPYESELFKMQRFIAYVLGDEPPIERILSNCGFGPGANVGVHGNATNASRKLLGDTWSCTPPALDLGYFAIRRHAQAWEALAPEHFGMSTGSNDGDYETYLLKVDLVSYNKIAFVKKTVKVHRTVAGEPVVNSFLQKGTDIVYRENLRRIGLDLTDQAVNSRMARQGSYDSPDGFVTIDLKNASNSVATEVVRDTHPPEWFDFLNRIRSRQYMLNGSLGTYSMFCSMGNGFCFPLETLLFAAACHAVGAGKPGIDFQVYGDDILVRKQFAAPLIALLQYLGFATNRQKTFLEGPFRESCGTDWYLGEDVRPYVLDDAFDTIESMYKFLNQTAGNPLWGEFFSPVRDAVINRIPKNLRLYRPYKGEYDTGIDSTGSEHLTCPTCRYRFVYGGGRWDWLELAHTPRVDYLWRAYEGRGGEAAAMYGLLSGSASRQLFTYRRETVTKLRRKTGSGATSQWLPPATRL